MNKNRIRLTESQLHNVIRESVKRVLSELDWKTYANAQNKMAQRADTGYWCEKGETFPNTISKAANARIRANRLGNAAKDSFNRDFGYDNGSKFYDNDYAKVGMGGDFNSTEEFAPHAAAWKHTGVASTKEYPHGVYTNERTPEEFFKGNPNAEDAINAYHTADNEIRNYKRGNYNYQKGKGWTLNK